jgi:hypothetical protein
VDISPRIEGDSEAADLGSACHHFMSERISGRFPDPDEVALRYDVNSDELARLVSWGWRCWLELANHFPNPQTEVGLGFGMLSGHVDVLSLFAREIRLADFKTGRVERDHGEQLKGYAWLALQHYPLADRVYAACINWRQQVVEGEYWSRGQLNAWYAGLEKKLEDTQTFRPGAHCAHCPRGVTCPAKTALLQQAAALIPDIERQQAAGAFDQVLPKTPEQRGAALAVILARAKMLEASAAIVREMVKAEVVQAGGNLPTGNGYELRIVEQAHKQIEFDSAWPILREEIPARSMNQCLKVVKGEVEKAVAAEAARGQKGAALRRLMELLEGAGAIHTKTIERLEVRRADSNHALAGPHAGRGDRESD